MLINEFKKNYQKWNENLPKVSNNTKQTSMKNQNVGEFRKIPRKMKNLTKNGGKIGINCKKDV